jgi:hypothetical protein
LIFLFLSERWKLLYISLLEKQGCVWWTQMPLAQILSITIFQKILTNSLSYEQKNCQSAICQCR